MRAALACLFISLLLFSPTARADEAASLEPEPPRRLVWRYPEFRAWEFVAASAVAAGNISLEVLYQGQPNERFTSPILGDARAREWLRADTKAGQLRADAISDYLWHGSTYYTIIDGLLTPLVSDRFNAQVALQLTLLNWQAMGAAGLVARLTHVSVGRRRPMLQGCSDDPNAPNPCRFEGASFIAGHAIMSSTNAGLACAAHLNLPLYGDNIVNDLVCPIMVTNALTVGVLRIVADKHWLSDTVPAWLLGGGIGFGLPYLLHYRHVKKVASPLPGTALVPWATPTAGGLELVGQL